MSNDVKQWLAEIKELKQQLADTIRDRDSVTESAANWRELYNTEAQQRRTEAKLAQQQIETLKGQIQILQQESVQLKSENPNAASAIAEEVGKLQQVDQLQAKLQEVMIERDRLLDALKIEQANHAQTSKSLTAVIGDTIDQLTKERVARSPSEDSQEIKNS
jgi:chromosome segregation ATPase